MMKLVKTSEAIDKPFEAPEKGAKLISVEQKIRAGELICIWLVDTDVVYYPAAARSGTYAQGYADGQEAAKRSARAYDLERR